MKLIAAFQDGSRADLIAEVVGSFGSARIRVQGSSMLPCIRPGDEIEVQAIPSSKIKLGDVVAYRRGDRLFVHRVIGTDPLTTRGDALSLEDAPLSEAELLGVVTRVSRRGEDVDHRNGVMHRMGAMLCRKSRLCAALFVKFACL